MNHDRAVFVINDDVRCVRCSYDQDWRDGQTKPPPSEQWTEFKTFQQNLKVGDFAVVETGTRYGMTVVRVEEVNVTPDIKSPKKIGWIVGIVDRKAHEAVLVAEAQAIEQIKGLERERERQEMRKTILGADEEAAKKISFATPKQIEAK